MVYIHDYHRQFTGINSILYLVGDEIVVKPSRVAYQEDKPLAVVQSASEGSFYCILLALPTELRALFVWVYKPEGSAFHQIPAFE